MRLIVRESGQSVGGECMRQVAGGARRGVGRVNDEWAWASKD